MKPLAWSSRRGASAKPAMVGRWAAIPRSTSPGSSWSALYTGTRAGAICGAALMPTIVEVRQPETGQFVRLA